MKHIAILLVFLMVACGSRKKEIETSEKKYSFKNTLDLYSSLSWNKDLSLHTQENTSSVNKDVHFEYEGNEGDSLQWAKYGPDGKLLEKNVISGKGKVNFSSSEGTANTDTKTTQNESLSGKEDIKEVSSSKGEGKEKAVSKVVESDSLTYIYWIIIACLLLYIFRRQILSMLHFKKSV